RGGAETDRVDRMEAISVLGDRRSRLRSRPAVVGARAGGEAAPRDRGATLSPAQGADDSRLRRLRPSEPDAVLRSDGDEEHARRRARSPGGRDHRRSARAAHDDEPAQRGAADVSLRDSVRTDGAGHDRFIPELLHRKRRVLEALRTGLRISAGETAEAPDGIRSRVHAVAGLAADRRDGSARPMIDSLLLYFSALLTL